MRIEISALLQKEGQREELTFSTEHGIPLEDFGSYHFTAPLAFKGTLLSEADRIVRLRGEIIVNWQSACVRCLNEVTREEVILVDEQIYPPGYHAELNRSYAEYGLDYTDPEDPLGHEELMFHDGTHVELDKLFSDLVLLALPIGVYCADDCPGLCPTCGRRLDDAACHCENSLRANSPFDKLLELL